eukprot:gnl/Trimastix_PCT/1648.p1 GENE.gnl/Trimastix_PCT/1648~~gnl/Trimastix_PCT/1648.p1  ORF type:complete len:816 (-),score=188.10 gnl/Trimastix_PCT/1648:29-2476(-)
MDDQKNSELLALQFLLSNRLLWLTIFLLDLVVLKLFLLKFLAKLFLYCGIGYLSLLALCFCGVLPRRYASTVTRTLFQLLWKSLSSVLRRRPQPKPVPIVRETCPASPLPVDLSRCQMLGTGMHSACVGQTSKFVLVARDSEGCMCPAARWDVRVQGPGGRPIYCQVTDEGDGTSAVCYTPLVSGEHTIAIAIDGAALPGTPLTLIAEPGEAIASRCSAEGSIHVVPCGGPLTFALLGRDRHNNSAHVSREALRIRLDHLHATPDGTIGRSPLETHPAVEVVEADPGQCSVFIQGPAQAGAYSLSIDLGGEAITGSPMTVHAVPQAVYDKLSDMRHGAQMEFNGRQLLAGAQSRKVRLIVQPGALHVATQKSLFRASSTLHILKIDTRLLLLLPADARDVQECVLFSPELAEPLRFKLEESLWCSALLNRAAHDLESHELGFGQKLAWMRRELRKRYTKLHPCRVAVRREHLIADSHAALAHLSPDELGAADFTVTFVGEEGADLGGLTKEWILLTTRSLFDPCTGLFVSDGQTIHPAVASAGAPGLPAPHLHLFRFAGRLAAKALCSELFIDAHFSRAMYKSILGRTVSIYDLEAADPMYFRNAVRYYLDNSIADIDPDLTFTTEDEDGQVIPLCRNGQKKRVTDANKCEYVDLLARYRLVTRVSDQLDSFIHGFHEVVPKAVVAPFTDTELELLLCGLPEVDVADLRDHTQYNACDQAHQVVVWLWECVAQLDQPTRKEFLQFVTGSSQVPLDGFTGLDPPFTVQLTRDAASALPRAHTCFNQLDLPQYESYQQLCDRILYAIRECSQGFGFA